MRLSYTAQERTPEVKTLAKQIVAEILRAKVTYSVASNALEAAQEILFGETKPVGVVIVPKED